MQKRVTEMRNITTQSRGVSLFEYGKVKTRFIKLRAGKLRVLHFILILIDCVVF